MLLAPAPLRVRPWCHVASLSSRSTENLDVNIKQLFRHVNCFPRLYFKQTTHKYVSLWFRLDVNKLKEIVINNYRICPSYERMSTVFIGL